MKESSFGVRDAENGTNFLSLSKESSLKDGEIEGLPEPQPNTVSFYLFLKRVL